MFEEPKPDDGSIQITVKYKIDPAKESEFLDAIHDYERIRRRDGAFRWDIFYDAEIPGMYLETFRVDSWGERERQHDRFTVADRECEERVLRFRLGRKEPNMMIIGVDYHPSFQTIAFFVEETGECGEQELNHSDGTAERFYRDLQQHGIHVRVCMEATGYSRCPISA